MLRDEAVAASLSDAGEEGRPGAAGLNKRKSRRVLPLQSKSAAHVVRNSGGTAYFLRPGKISPGRFCMEVNKNERTAEGL